MVSLYAGKLFVVTVNVSCLINFLCDIGLGRGILDELTMLFPINSTCCSQGFTPILFTDIKFVFDAVERISGVTPNVGVLVPV